MSTFDGVHGTVCNEQQYDLWQSQSENDPHPTITCLTQGQTIGLALTAEASFISFAAVIVVFVLIVRNVRRYRKALPDGDWKLLRTPADIYMLSLFVYDILQAMGGILDVRWAHEGIVTTGRYCTAQGAIQQAGELGVALITLILTVHTFVVALWKLKEGTRARRFAFGVVALATLFIALWVGLGNGLDSHGPNKYETPTPYWCWIGPHNEGQRLGGEYVWLWIALFASVIMYIPLHFMTEGRWSIEREKWYKFRLSESDDGYLQRRAALGMLFYPLAYSLMVLPLSVTRWSSFRHKSVPSAATFFSVAMFNLSGAINVLLFLIVRPQLLLFLLPETEPEELEPKFNDSPLPGGTTLPTLGDGAEHVPESNS